MILKSRILVIIINILLNIFLNIIYRSNQKVILDVEHQFVLLNINPELNFKSIDLFNRFNLNENEDYVFGYGNYMF